MENKEINVFIISYNRLTYLKKLVDWLVKADFKKIHIVDNASTYLPLLKYFEKTKAKVHRLEKNWGHLAVWECGKFEAILKKENYIVSDCDVLPVEECPLNVTSYFKKILDQYSSFTKVGFGLKIDDLPEKYVFRENVLKWEKQFWKKKIAPGLYEASIDTTFAFYRPGIFPDEKKWWKAIRTDAPYLARHLPWYEDSNDLSAEEIYYQKNLRNRDSFWSVVEVEKLKKYNRELFFELTEVRKSFSWKFLRWLYFFLGLFFGEKLKDKFNNQEFFLCGKNDRSELQKENKKLLVELDKIYSTKGWIFLEKMKKIFQK
mgnify:CR=1 FL=1